MEIKKSRYFIYLAYEFPPLQSGGTYRTLGIVNCLKNTGLVPIIITRDVNSINANEQNPIFDFSLLEDINSQAVIIRIPSELNSKKISKLRLTFRIIFNPNGIENKFWKRNVLLKIDEVILRYQPEFILTTAPPFSIIDLGHKISKNYNLKHILDLRDAWSNWFTAPYLTYFHYLLKFRKERFHLRAATKIIVTSRQTIEDFQQLHKKLNPNKFAYIPNGFDGEIHKWEENVLSEKIKIGYVGSFYYQPNANKLMMSNWCEKKRHHKLNYVPNKQNWLYRSPYFFFKTIKLLLLKYPEYCDKIEIHFLGKKEDWFDSMVLEFDLEKYVFHHGIKNRTESMKFQREMNWLLITSSKLVGGRDYSIAGKTYEYFQVQKPVLAFVCDGAQKDILVNSGVALICDPDKEDENVEIIRPYFDGTVKLSPNEKYIANHSRSFLSKIFIDELKKIV